jgi:folate-binding protein YgfZ
VDRDPFGDEIDALDEDRAALPAAGWIVTRVRGGDALAWLNDLVTADLERLEPGEVVRSLLLSPTGRIRADLLVAREPESLLTLQTPDQPRSLAELLGPYLLSSDVVLETIRTDGVLAGGASGWRLAPEAPPGHLAVGPDGLEAWRIRRGVARFPVDLDEESLPAEAGLDREPVIDRGKGCYLGQESVAKVRNLGHPTRVVVPATLDGAASAGDRIRSGAEEVGVVTSLDGGNAIVRIRWAARAHALETDRGTPLTASYPPSG